MSGAKRRRPGTTESPEEARGRLTRNLFALYDQHPLFRDALRRIADENRDALESLGTFGIDLAFGSAQMRTATSPAIADYVTALERFAEHWGLFRLPDGQGLDALHAWCLLSHASGDTDTLAFGAGHLISSLVAGVDTTVRLGEFVDRWDPGEEQLADQLLSVPEHLLAEIGSHPSVRLRNVRGRLGWYITTEGARTRIREAAVRAERRHLTPAERHLLDEQLARIEAASAAVEHVHSDTTPEEEAHLRWVFQRLAPVGRDDRPLGVWQVAIAENASEKTVRNETDKLRKRLGIDRFPKASRRPERGPRSRSSR